MLEETLKKKRHRSPNHPSIDLKEAVERVVLLHRKYGLHSVPIMNACETVGYSSLNSSALQCIAAMIAYGLLEGSGSGGDRKVSVSPMGDRIARNAPDRSQLLREAAKKPSIHQEILDHYPSGLPHKDILVQYLVWERDEGARFNQDAVEGFIQRLRDTLEYAGVTEDGKIGGNESGETPESPSAVTVAVGDLVQWTSGGVDMFVTPKKVSGMSADGAYAFLEGERTGVLVSELAVVESPLSKSSSVTLLPPSNPRFTPLTNEEEVVVPGVAKDRMTLDEGPVMVSWPATLSSDSVLDLEAWFDVLVARLKRKAGISKTPKPKHTTPPT